MLATSHLPPNHVGGSKAAATAILQVVYCALPTGGRNLHPAGRRWAWTDTPALHGDRFQLQELLTATERELSASRSQCAGLQVPDESLWLQGRAARSRLRACGNCS
jgi:hypothetical protein